MLEKLAKAIDLKRKKRALVKRKLHFQAVLSAYPEFNRGKSYQNVTQSFISHARIG